MELRFYEDPDTDQPHIYGHGVTEEEVRQVLDRSGEDRPSSDDSRMAIGQTAAGRYLRVIYVPDPGNDSAFVITAYELPGQTTQSLSKSKEKERTMSQQQYPPGWDESRVRKLISHYDQMDDEAMIAEDEAAAEAEGQTLMVVPTELVPDIRELLARKASA